VADLNWYKVTAKTKFFGYIVIIHYRFDVGVSQHVPKCAENKKNDYFQKKNCF